MNVIKKVFVFGVMMMYFLFFVFEDGRVIFFDVFMNFIFMFVIFFDGEEISIKDFLEDICGLDIVGVDKIVLLFIFGIDLLFFIEL